MYKEKTVAVVIPAYNEANHIEAVIGDLPDWIDHIFVVDDASQDDTVKKVTALSDGRITLIQSRANGGVGSATKLGYRSALEANSDIIVKVDGDGQMPLACLPDLLDAIVCGGYAYAKGNRFMDSDALQKMPKSRLFGNIALTFLTKVASGYWHIFDPQNGFTAIDADTLKAIHLDNIHPRFFFENDMLVALNIHNARVKDVPIPAIYADEQSKISVPKILLTFPWLLKRRFWHRVYQKYVLRDFSPIALFLVIGILLMFWGVGFGAYLWIQSLGARVPTTTGTVMLAVIPLIMGFQLLLQAFVMDIYETPR